MTFCTINIPYSAQRENETNEDTFNRIIDTYMSQFDDTYTEIDADDLSVLGAWVLKYFKRFKQDAFPCAWIEDDNGFLIEYFVFFNDKKGKYLRHEIVEL